MFVGKDGQSIAGAVLPAVEGARVEAVWTTEHESGQLQTLTDQDGLVCIVTCLAKVFGCVLVARWAHYDLPLPVSLPV